MMIGCDDNSFNPWEMSNYRLLSLYCTKFVLSCLFNKSFTIWQSTWLPPLPTSSGWHQTPHTGCCWPCDTSPSWPRTRRRRSRCYRSPGSPPCQWTLRIERILFKLTWGQAINQLWRLTAGSLNILRNFNFPNWHLYFTINGSHLCLSLSWAPMWRHSWRCPHPTWCCRRTCTC